MLELRNVYKTFDAGTPMEVKIIQGLNLTINEGEFITVIGGNGAGKSTMLNLIAGARSVDEGLILLNGFNISLLSENKRAPYFGRVFQDPMLGTAADMTILENLTLAYGRGTMRSLFRWSTKRKEKAFFIEQLKSLDLGLETRLNDKVGLLSGGQRQAITLLMATIKKTPSIRSIKRDYVRFYQGNKAEAKEKMEADLARFKKEYDADIANINSMNYRHVKRELIKQHKKLNLAEKGIVSASKIKLLFTRLSSEEKKALKEQVKKDSLDRKQVDLRKKEAKSNYFKKIKQYDLTKQILLLDEHTAALDPKTAAKVLEITDRIIKENNLTTIMITHNMKDAIKYGNRLIMMSKGHVAVDVSGEKKSKLQVEDLLKLFQEASKDDFLSDSQILG